VIVVTQGFAGQTQSLDLTRGVVGGRKPHPPDREVIRKGSKDPVHALDCNAKGTPSPRITERRLVAGWGIGCDAGSGGSGHATWAGCYRPRPSPSAARNSGLCVNGRQRGGAS